MSAETEGVLPGGPLIVLTRGTELDWRSIKSQDWGIRQPHATGSGFGSFLYSVMISISCKT